MIQNWDTLCYHFYDMIQNDLDVQYQTSHDMSVLGYTSDVKKGCKTNHDRAKKNTMYNQQQYLGFTYFVLEKKTHPNPMV